MGPMKNISAHYEWKYHKDGLIWTKKLNWTGFMNSGKIYFRDVLARGGQRVWYKSAYIMHLYKASIIAIKKINRNKIKLFYTLLRP